MAAKQAKKTKEALAAEIDAMPELGGTAKALLLHDLERLTNCPTCGNAAEGLCLVCGSIVAPNPQPAPSQE